MKIVSQHDYKPFAGEHNDGKSFVETAGYIPAKQKIESFMQAGINLQTVRSQFDYPDGVPDGVEPMIDPTRSGNFDLADASALAQSALNRLNEVKPQESNKNASTGDYEPVEDKKRRYRKMTGVQKLVLSKVINAVLVFLGSLAAIFFKG